MRLPRDNDALIAQGLQPHLVRVYLNEKLMSRIHGVDDEEGWVETLKYTDTGDKAGTYYDRQYGKVRIRFPDNDERLKEYQAKHSAGFYQLDQIYVWAYDDIYVSPDHEDYVVWYLILEKDPFTPRRDEMPSKRGEMVVPEFFEKAIPLHLPSEFLIPEDKT